MRSNFYYKGKLVRTSNHDYKFAVLREEENGSLIVRSCSTTREGAEKALTDIRKRYDPEYVALYKIVEIDR